MVVFLLHWGFGVGEAAARVICFEPDGRVAIESVGKLCSDTSRSGKHCVDLPADDGHSEHEPAPGADVKVSVASPQTMLVSMFYFQPLPTAGPSLPSRLTTPPTVANLTVVLRESTVLRI